MCGETYLNPEGRGMDASSPTSLSQRGYSIAPDLYGDDRPEETAAFYEQAFAWLSSQS
jgi:hypothetical protein